MSLNNPPQICKIKSIKEKYIEIIFSNGEALQCFFEDFPYFEDGSQFCVDDEVLFRREKNIMTLEKKRARQNISFRDELNKPRKKLKTELMRSFDFKPLKAALPFQIADELNRIKKENPND